MDLQIGALYNDFYNLVIFDVLKPLLISNISIEVPLIKIKDEIGKVFVDGALKYKVDYPKISEILKNQDIPSEIIDYIIDLLSKFANKLDSYFLKDIKDPNSALEGKDLQIILDEFNSIISEYVLFSYFDLITLKQAISLLTYGTNLSLTEIYQFREQCVELFKTAMSIDIDLGIGDVLNSIRDKLEELIQNEKIIDLIIMQFMSFFEFLISSEDLLTIIPILKPILLQKTIDYRQLTPFIASSDVKIIIEWFKKQVIDLPIAMMMKMYSIDLQDELLNAQKEFLDLFKLFIQDTIPSDNIEKMLLEIGKKIGILDKIYKMEDNIFEFFEMQQSLDLVKDHSLNKIRTKFDFNIPRLPQNLDDKGMQENAKIIIYLRVFDSIMVYCEFIEEERRIDPTLKRLVSYIKHKIQVVESLYI